jgi:hypothetical protein
MASVDFIDEQIGGLAKESVYWKYINHFRKYHTMFQNLVSKVPDQLELNHR